MKFKVTQLMGAAAIAASLSGQAMALPITAAVGDIASVNEVPLVLESGSRASLVYSSGEFNGVDTDSVNAVVGAFNESRIRVRDINGLGVEETFLDDNGLYPQGLVRTTITAGLQVNAHTIDHATGQILSVSTAGSLEHRGTRISGTLTGGVATVTNLRFDLENKRVYADLAGTKAAVGYRPAVNYNLPDTVLWTIGSVSGPTIIDPAALALTGQARLDALVANGFNEERDGTFSALTTVSDLQMTQAGFDFRNSLGLLHIGLYAFEHNKYYGWGSATLKLNFSVPAVPEPGSYVLAATGLLVVWGARRARRSGGA